MEGAWFSGVADELARCLSDAARSADACEEVLESLHGRSQNDRERVLAVLVAPAAIARALIDLIDQPPRLVLAACRLCRESARTAIGELELLDARVDVSAALAALDASAASCETLLDAAA